MRFNEDRLAGFSPVAGIQWVETSDRSQSSGTIAFYVSVPLPGFSGLRQSKKSMSI